MSLFNLRECLGCGQPCDGFHCYSCTCSRRGINLLNRICINCIYGDGKPVTCDVCEGLLGGGFCLSCDLKAENSFTYDPNAYSFNYTSSNFNHLPQPQYKNYLCNLCGNNSHDGYDCQQQFPFVYEQEPSYNQIYNGNYYPHDSPSFLCGDNCGGSHATFQCQPMDQNIDSSSSDQIQTPQYPVIHQSSLEIKDTNELFQELLEDLQIIKEELSEYINSPSWNYPTFYDDDEEHSVQYKEYLEKSPDAVTTVLPIEEPEYSLSMGYEHPNTTLEMESDEIINSGVEDLVPIPNECEDIEYVEASLPNPEIISLEEKSIVYQKEEEESDNSISLSDNSSLEFETFSDHTEETRSGSTTTHADNSLPEYDSVCFKIEPDQERSENKLSNFNQDDPLFPRPPPEPPNVEFDFESNSGEEISAVMNDNDELESFDPG
nr:hypothetical protein [Tanacetum cinerariifolium]